jgi:hypothetical protein
MGRINGSRVLLGGLVAGVVINIGEFIYNGLLTADAMANAMARFDLEGYAPGAMIIYVIMAFVMGIFAVWLYAAMRPRFGPGPGTAIYAGLAFWIPASLFQTITQLGVGLWPTGLLWAGTAWMLVELPVATLAGAYVYREEAEADRGVAAPSSSESGPGPIAPPPGPTDFTS